MSDNDYKQEKEFIKVLSKELDINVENIYHVILIGGQELIGEFVQSDKKETVQLICNPLKIIKDIVISETGSHMLYDNLFIDWNPHSAGPFANINKSTIVSITKPNHKTIYSYMQTMQEEYFPLNIQIDEDDLMNVFVDNIQREKPNYTNNVIDFNKYVK